MFQWLRAWLRKAGPGYVISPAPLSAPEWTDEDRVTWGQFIASPTGIRLMARSSAVGYAIYREACQDQFHTSHSAGVAAGFEQCRQHLLSLSRCSSALPKEQTHIDTHGSGESRLREALSP